MPWGLLIRIASLVLAAIGASRLRRDTVPGAPSGRGTPAGRGTPRSRLRRRVDDAREGVSLLARTVAIVIALLFALLATTGGLTLVATGPLWLGVVFLAAALVAWITSAIEVLRVRGLVNARRKRREMQAAVHVVESPPDEATSRR